MSDSDAMFIYWAIWGFYPHPFSLPSLSSMNLEAANAFFSSDEWSIPLIVDSASSIRLFLASNIRSLNPNLSMAFHSCFGEHFRYAHMSNVRPEYLSIASSSIFYASFSLWFAFSMCWCFFSYILMSDGVIVYSVLIFGFMVVVSPVWIIPHLKSTFCGLVVHHFQLMLHQLVLQIDVFVMLSQHHDEGCPYCSCYVAKGVLCLFNVELVDCLHAAYHRVGNHILLQMLGISTKVPWCDQMVGYQQTSIRIFFCRVATILTVNHWFKKFSRINVVVAFTFHIIIPRCFRNFQVYPSDTWSNLFSHSFFLNSLSQPFGSLVPSTCLCACNAWSECPWRMSMLYMNSNWRTISSFRTWSYEGSCTFSEQHRQ